MECKKRLIEKISNPESFEGEVDGIILGGNRNNSYAWCMEERNGYIYIGTNNNLLSSFGSGSGISEEESEFFKKLFDYSLPEKDESNSVSQIIKVNPYTSETKVLYEPEEGTDNSYRMVVKYDNKLYFGSFGYNEARIIMIDEYDEPSIVFDKGGRSSFRAGAVYNGKLYFAGLDSRINDNGEYMKLAILEKDIDSDYIWNRVADYRDFINYASEAWIENEGGNLWDLVSYNNELYIFLTTKEGFVLFKGHKGEEYEKTNEYGWVWQEVIGLNGEYNIGMLNKEDTSPLISNAATPFVYKNKMYFGTFDNIFSAALSAFLSLYQGIVNKDYDLTLSKSLEGCYNIINNPQKMYSMDRYNNIEEITEVQNILRGTCNEYIWRFCEYNGKLFFSTFDAAIIYKYIVKLINEYYLEDYEENTLVYLDDIGEVIEAFSNKELVDEFCCFVSILEDFYKSQDCCLVKKLEDSYKDICTIIEDLIYVKYYYNSEENKQKVKEVKDILNRLRILWNKIDLKGYKKYLCIEDLVRKNKAGFDLYESEDGKKYKCVTLDGFKDKYNYGGRSLISNNNGLFVGTANPFYGAQLWRITSFGY